MTSASQPNVARPHRSKRGTVLIFVIGVLVLMALAATAYLTTARVDRATTKQNEFNTQVELLMEGLKKAAIAKITTGDETAATDFRTLVNGTVAGTVPTKGSYFADRPGIDTWLANRAPFLANSTAAMNLASNPPVWSSLSAGVLGTEQFEEPTTGTIIAANDTRGLYRNMVPTSKNGKPALAFASAMGTAYYGADADGDGIADSGFVRLPVGKVNGLTYYVAYRIVDHNSAVNATTAMSRDEDYDRNGVVLPTTGQIASPTGLFTTSVGLREMLTGGVTEFNTFRSYKLGGATPATVIDSTTPATYQDYRSIGDLLFHGLNRRSENPATGLAGFGINDQISLSYRNGAIRDTNASQSQAEKTLAQSLYTNAKPVAYKPTDITTWFNDLYNEVGSTPVTRRPYVTTWNPTSSVVRGFDFTYLLNSHATDNYINVVQKTGETPPALTPLPERIIAYDKVTTTTPYEKLPQRCSVNTASFSELWRAYLNVMVNPTPPVSPAPVQPENANCFAPPVGRANTTYGFTTTEQMIIRAAQAAVNTIDLRDDDDDISVRQIRVRPPAGAGPAVDYVVNVFGTERQPFITQSVFADDGTGAHSYAAIELYNPYETPLVMVTDWQLAMLERDPAATGFTVTPIFAIPNGTTIAPRGYLVLESANSRPTNVTLTPSPDPTVRGSNNVISNVPLNAIKSAFAVGPREIILMRPKQSNGPVSGDVTTTPNTVEPTESLTAPDIRNLVPLDQVQVNMPSPGVPTVYWRGRPNALVDGTGAVTNFKCVFEDVAAAWQDTTNGGTARAITLGQASLSDTAPTNFPTANFPTIQIAADNTPRPYPAYGPNQYGYPYNGFGTLGDLSHVPFIGSTTIFDSTGTTLLDINSISLDASAAQDATIANNLEAVGKFDQDNYEWSRDLFDFFTVINHPKDEYTFNVPKSDNVSGINRQGFNFDLAAPTPTVLTDVGPVQGLININTAPAKVLAMLPWLPPAADALTYNANGTITLAANLINDNEDIANAIVHYRDASEIPNNGVDDNADGQIDEVVIFNSISDLLRIPAMITVRDAILAAAEPGDIEGDPTPVDDPLAGPPVVNTDGARNDLEENTLLLTRVSNLITTRSDTYTVYILLQGYRDGGTPSAELVVQRRAAIIVDRSKIEPKVTDASVSRVWAE